MPYGLTIQDKVMEGTLETSLELPRVIVLIFGRIFEDCNQKFKNWQYIAFLRPIDAKNKYIAHF